MNGSEVWIATTELRATSAEGITGRVMVRFAAPVERDGVWWCRHSIEGTINDSLEIAGDDALQALTLSIAFVGHVLEHYVSRGGRLEYVDGGAFAIEMHFPRVTMAREAVNDLRTQFGAIDVYLFDQLLRGRIPPNSTVLDAGCGTGRNLVFFLRMGYRVLGSDADASSIASVRRLAAELAPHTPDDAFRTEPVEAMSFADGIADVVISSAVLHFARDEAHFWEMLRGTWRVLKPGGMLFCRLAGLAGQEGAARALGGRRYSLPDGSERFLSDESFLRAATHSLGCELLDPLKTTIVHGQRSMTTWVVRRRSLSAG